ncbi:hypothetical protein MMC16_006003 [Acarospora aff. strigata]|nr:hypothetical protein [Acarospora aff. strigata]
MAGPDMDVVDLIKKIQDTYPTGLPVDGWYLLTASSLVACGRPEAIADLYQHLVTQEAFATSAQRKVLSRKLRDLLMKEWTLTGIPLVITAVAALAKVEKDEDADWSGNMATARLDEATEQRGTAFLQQLYKQNLEPIFSTWGCHRTDFESLERMVIYGLFLSDHTVLSPVETEIVVLSAIMCQGLRGPTIWHLRGLRRLGISEVDVDGVQRAVELVASWLGRDVKGWPTVKDVADAIHDQ